AASGIGVAVAEALVEVGARVALIDINEQGAAQIADRLKAEYGRPVWVLRADVTRAEEINAAIDRVATESGRLDVVFANAGIAEQFAPLADYQDIEWDRVIAVNLTGVYLTDKAAARVMIGQRSGRIINTASIYGLVGDFALGAYGYTAAKGGVVNLTRTLAIHLAPHQIRVNAIAPAFIHTNIAGGLLQPDVTDPGVQEVHRQIQQRTPLGRFGEPEDLKGIAVFLASEASAYCTGYTYAVDGGWLAW
ncbi:MAG: SDR family oxidoreductase, partial [Ktedonobacteraceae bacterium]|nr:SDR family oxidoreductase [Ktedonobacteraceae bacterium]